MSFTRAILGRTGIEVCRLGLASSYGAPPPRILDACRKLRERGLVRYLAVSTHNRPLIARLATDPQFDIFHML